MVLLDDDPLQPIGASAAVGKHLRDMQLAATFLAGGPTHLAI